MNSCGPLLHSQTIVLRGLPRLGVDTSPCPHATDAPGYRKCIFKNLFPFHLFRFRKKCTTLLGQYITKLTTVTSAKCSLAATLSCMHWCE